MDQATREKFAHDVAMSSSVCDARGAIIDVELYKANFKAIYDFHAPAKPSSLDELLRVTSYGTKPPYEWADGPDPFGEIPLSKPPARRMMHGDFTSADALQPKGE